MKRKEKEVGERKSERANAKIENAMNSNGAQLLTVKFAWVNWVFLSVSL